MNGDIVRRLLAFEPFKRFSLVTTTGHEYEVKSPGNYRVIGEADTLFWSEDGTADFIDLKLIERVRIDDDFGPVELDRLWE